MRERAIGAYLYRLSIFFLILRITGAIIQPVHGAITEETINLIYTIMTGIIFAFFIFKKLG
jgi:hypothetical protein